MPPNAIDPKDVKAAKSAIEGAGADASYRAIERLAEEISSRVSGKLSKPNQQAPGLLTAFLKDTAEFIYKSYKTKGKLSTTEITQYVLKKHKNFLKAIGFDHAACGVAVAQLIVTLTTAVPMMSMEVKALVVTGGMAFATGGAGVPFALGSGALLALSVLSVYLSVSQTAQVCSASLSALADQAGTANFAQAAPRRGGTAQLRCEVPVNQFPSFVFGMLGASLAKTPEPAVLYTPFH